MSRFDTAMEAFDNQHPMFVAAAVVAKVAPAADLTGLPEIGGEDFVLDALDSLPEFVLKYNEDEEAAWASRRPATLRMVDDIERD